VVFSCLSSCGVYSFSSPLNVQAQMSFGAPPCTQPAMNCPRTVEYSSEQPASMSKAKVKVSCICMIVSLAQHYGAANHYAYYQADYLRSHGPKHLNPDQAKKSAVGVDSIRVRELSDGITEQSTAESQC
jgi:hypothetical protein